MASNYPSSVQTFSNPQATDYTTSPDHAVLHSTENDTLSAIQTVLGTTAGTSVLKDFAAGQFPVRNSGGTLQGTLTLNNGTLGTATLIGGTINNAFLGTAQITGGTLTLPKVINVTLGSAVYQGTVSGTVTVDLSTATRHLINLPNSAGSVKINISNVSENQPFIVDLLGGTAGLGTVGWFSTVRWVGSVTPTLTQSASRYDTFGFMPIGTASFLGYIVGQNL